MSKKSEKNIEQCCINCINLSCRVPYNEKIGVDEYGVPMGLQCIGFISKDKKVKKLELANNKKI